MTTEQIIIQLLDWEEHDEGKINDTRKAAAGRLHELEGELAEAKKVLERIASYDVQGWAQLALIKLKEKTHEI